MTSSPPIPAAGLPVAALDPGQAASALVLDVLAELLGDGTDEGDPVVGPGTDLFALPTFDSLALVELVERLEARLGVVFGAGEIVPEAFESPARIATRLVAPVLRKAHR
jgi:acyl carrier protein